MGTDISEQFVSDAGVEKGDAICKINGQSMMEPRPFPFKYIFDTLTAGSKQASQNSPMLVEFVKMMEEKAPEAPKTETIRPPSGTAPRNLRNPSDGSKETGRWGEEYVYNMLVKTMGSGWRN